MVRGAAGDIDSVKAALRAEVLRRPPQRSARTS